MKPRTLLVLFLLVAALGLFIWFVERDLPSTDERAERARKVLPVTAEDVTAIEITSGGNRARLTRRVSEGEGTDEESRWRLAEPLDARADAPAVEDLLQSLVELEKKRTLEEFDAAELGLDVPRATVRLTAGDDREWLLQIGEEIPASSNVVVAIAGGDEAYVVADSLRTDLEKAPGAWRSRRAFPAERDEIASLRFDSAGREVTLARDGDLFRLVSPFADEADEGKVEELLDAVADLEIESFLDPPVDLAALGLEPPVRSVSVEVEDAESPIEIRLGRPVGGDAETIHAYVAGQAFETETDLGELLEAEITSWQSTAWSRLDAYEIDAIEVQAEEGEMRLEREAGDWHRNGVKIPYTAASDLLYALQDVVAGAVRPTSELGAGDPLLEVTLTSSDDSENLLLRPVGDGGFAAQRQGREYALILDRETVDEILQKVEAVRSAEALPEVDG